MRIVFNLNKRNEPELVDLIILHARRNRVTEGEAVHDLLRELIERKLNSDFHKI